MTLFMGSLKQLDEFYGFIKTQSIMYCNNALGIRQMNKKFNSVETYQTVLNLDDAFVIGEKKKTRTEISQIATMGCLSLDKSNNLMIDLLSKNDSRMGIRVSESDFISCPSGDLNIIVKSVSSANSQMFVSQKHIKFELVSDVA